MIRRICATSPRRNIRRFRPHSQFSKHLRMSYTAIPSKATIKPDKFVAKIEGDRLNKFKQLIQLSELGPETYENTTSEMYCGLTYDFMKNVKQQWLQDYDWRKTEEKINSYPNYTVEIEDGDEKFTIHFVALYSEKKDAIPIIFMHGWPGSFLEFLGFIDAIKAKYPSSGELPYHIIVPSLPGYAYSSSASLKHNLTKEDSVRVMDKLMQGLGFSDGYVAQGGDIGSSFARILAAKYPSCKACHLNMCLLPKPDNVPDSALNPGEKAGVDRFNEFNATGSAYAREHATRPSTIGFVLSSSPLALFAWIAEKFLTWTDKDPPLNDILDSVTLYWFTQSFPRSIYPYRDAATHSNPDYHITGDKVFGYSHFPQDLGSLPKAWVETTGNLVWYKQHTSGGHFASMERPEALLEDVEDFVRQVWK